MILGILSDLPDNYEVNDFQQWQKDCVHELCRVTATDEELTGCIFVVNRYDGNLGLSYLYSTNSKDLSALVSATAKDASELCPDASLVFDAVNEMSAKLAEKVFPKAVKVPIYEAVL